MDTISKDKGRIWDSLQFKFGLSYILIIAGVLLLLNTYPLRVSQDLVFRSKATTLQSSVSVMVYSLSGLDRLTEENVSQAMAVVEETGLSRILVTDSAGKVLYDTRETNDALGEYSFYTEIVQALLGNDVFSSSYRDGAFRSRAASPVLYQNQIIGAVYAYEYDTEQAALLEGLQGNLLRLSAGIAVVVLCLSGLLSRALTRKIGQLLTAIREVREGAYSHRAEVPGRDEIAQLAQEFNSLTDRLQTTENARRRFVSDASHELKTPLTVIMTNAELLNSPDFDETRRSQFAAHILTMSRQMRQLIEEMLDLARTDSGQSTLIFSQVDLSRLISDAVLPFEPVFFEAGLTLAVDIQPGLTVRGSHQHLRQTVDILLDNARKYAAPSGEISVTLTRCGGRCRLAVSNPGPEISKADLQNIFKRFYRADEAHTQQGSYGLGLSIARNIILRHRGRIWAESKNGRNTFFVELPVK